MNTTNFGNKVTVGYKYKDEDMYTDEFGRVMDLCVPSAGIINRSNPGQNYEMTVNFLSNRMIKELKELKVDGNVFKHCIIEFTKLICKVNSKGYEQRFKIDSGLLDEIRELEYIILRLNPFYYELDLSNFGKLVDLVMSVNPDKFREIDDLYLDFYRQGKFVGRGICAPVYIMRAKQTGLSKLSYRGVDDEGSDGTNKKTQRGQAHSNNPVKSSEKDKANEASIMSSLETSLFEDEKDKMTPLLSYFRQQMFKLII